jgi:hypothetical protein
VTIVQPNLQEQDGHEIPEIDESEHGHGRGAMGRQVHLERTLGATEVQLQRQRRHEKERQRGEQRETIGRLYGFDAEDAFERSQDKCASDESGEKRIDDDENAPLQLNLIGIHETLNRHYILLSH